MTIGSLKSEYFYDKQGCDILTLKELRQKKGIAQKELAKLSGVKRSTIAQYECGKIMPSLKVAVKLAKALEVSVEEIYQAWVEGKM